MKKKRKLGRKLLSFLLTLVMIMGLMPAFSMTALADVTTSSYILTIPATLTVGNAGWNATDGIRAEMPQGDSFNLKKRVNVTATSANEWKLKSGENTIGYNLASSTGDYNSTATPETWTFWAADLNAGKTSSMGIIVDDYSTSPAGTYQDTVTFTASVGPVVTPEDIGMVIGANWKLYDTAAAAEAENTTASGIVVYVGEAGSADASSSVYYGLAMSLQDAERGAQASAGGNCVTNVGTVAAAITYKNGIENTTHLCTDGHTHTAASKARNYNVARPQDASEWFLPSVGQCNLVSRALVAKAGRTVSDLTGNKNSNLEFKVFNPIITAAGGTGLNTGISYQTCTENGAYSVWTWSPSGRIVPNNRSGHSGCIRPFFAF